MLCADIRNAVEKAEKMDPFKGQVVPTNTLYQRWSTFMNQGATLPPLKFAGFTDCKPAFHKISFHPSSVV